MGDGNDGAGEVLEKLLQPRHRLGVEVVGGLVEQNHVGLGQQQPTQRDAAFLAAGEGFNACLPRGKVQRFGGLVENHVDVVAVQRLDLRFELLLLFAELVEIGVFFGVRRINRVKIGLQLEQVAQRLLDVAAHVLGGVQLRLLRQVAHLDARLRPRFTVKFGVDARHDLQQRGFARAVVAQHANLGAGKEGQGDVPQNLFLGRDGLADLVHRENVLAHGRLDAVVETRAALSGSVAGLSLPAGDGLTSND